MNKPNLGNYIVDSVTFCAYSSFMSSPRTLQEAIIYFADADTCLKFFAAERWPNGVICPTCGSKEVKFIPTRKLWECKWSARLDLYQWGRDTLDKESVWDEERSTSLNRW